MASFPSPPPPAERWELYLAEDAVDGELGDGTRLRGLLLILDPETGMVVHAAPVPVGAPLEPVLTQAATHPANGRPGRPGSITCPLSLMKELMLPAARMGARLQAAPPSALMLETVAHLNAHMGGDLDLVLSNPGWPALLADLLREAPWHALPDEVAFRFPDTPGLEATAALVIGHAGVQRGLMLFPTDADRARFARAAHAEDQDAALDVAVTLIELEPVDDLPDDVAAELEDAGQVVGGVALTAYARAEGALRALTPDDEAHALTAARAVLAMFRLKGASLAMRSASATVTTPSGPVRVDTEIHPAGPEPLLVARSHQLVLASMSADGEMLPGLVIKLHKADAERLARLLDGVNRVDLEEQPEGTALVVWAGPERLGVLARGPFGDAVRRHVGSDVRVLLVVSAGGPRGKGLSEGDMVENWEVTFGSPEPRASAPPPVPQTDAAYAGPATTWPKASDVLLDFARPFELEGKPLAQVRKFLDLAATVWSAVVAADNQGDPRFLDDIRRTLKGDRAAPAIERAIALKRTHFHRDTRMITVQKVYLRGTEIRVEVAWAEA